MNRKDHSIAKGILFTDQYQLTMAQLYYRMGLHEKTVQFDYFFRNYPDYGSHQGGFCINAGLDWLAQWMQESKVRDQEIELLRSQKTKSGGSLFSEDFLEWFKDNGSFEKINISSIAEGRVIHANVPVLVAHGPLAMAQILESALLNHLNYQILVATKAARIKEAGQSSVLLEFGLRRGQDLGAIAGARAALIGGADFSSNVGISHVLGYQPKGTHAHSMVQVFMALGHGELGAFGAYADIYPDDCLLLVDTINTLESGVPNAIKVFEKLKKNGHNPVGIRLDSGDLAYLAMQSAKMLNNAGFKDTIIVLSNQLDELVIWQIVTQIKNEASRYGLDADNVIKRLVYGVGTNLLTSKGYSALDGVYKLTAVKNNQHWIPSIKVSETKEKILNPGHKHVWRIYDNRDKAIADLIGLEHENPQDNKEIMLHHPIDPTKVRMLKIEDISKIEPLLENVIENGKCTGPVQSIEDMRNKRDNDLNHLDPGVKRLINPHVYHVSLTEELWKLKQEVLAENL